MEHTNKRYDQELSALSRKLSEMGDLVVSRLETALRAFAEHDLEAARAIIERDVDLNRMDIEIEELSAAIGTASARGSRSSAHRRRHDDGD